MSSANDYLTSRAGLNPFVQYLQGIKLFPHLKSLFGSISKHPKGGPSTNCSISCSFLFDGTSRHLAHLVDGGDKATWLADMALVLQKWGVARV